MSDDDKFQGLCLTSSKGYIYMPNYDEMPPRRRHLLAEESPFNICPACFNIEISYREADCQLRGIEAVEREVLRDFIHAILTSDKSRLRFAMRRVMAGT